MVLIVDYTIYAIATGLFKWLYLPLKHRYFGAYLQFILTRFLKNIDLRAWRIHSSLKLFDVIPDEMGEGLVMFRDW
jgi:hypothetical protein